jgi:hypothetical protein
MAINYASENLYKAVLYSMRSTESLQERLQGCYSIFHVLSQKGHLPPELQGRFDVMIEAMTMMPDDTGKGTLYATTSRMDELEARKWLEEILSLFMEVEKIYEAEGPHKSFD